MPQLVNFERLWNNSEKNIFRLELLNQYIVEDENEEFENFKQGKETEDSKEFTEFLEEVKQKVNAGIAIEHVHVVDLPFTDYLKFETKGHLKMQEQGAKFYMVERKDVDVEGFTDFWMFDDKVVLPMKYDRDGKFLGEGEMVIEVEKFVSLKNNLLEKSRPLNEFV